MEILQDTANKYTHLISQYDKILLRKIILHVQKYIELSIKYNNYLCS